MAEQYLVDEKFIKEFRLLKQWVRNFRVSGAARFKNNPGLGTASLHVQGGRKGRGPANDKLALVKITEDASGGGKYFGYVWGPPLSSLDNIPESTNASADEVGHSTEADERKVLIVNMAEENQSTHAITEDEQNVRIFLAYRHPLASSSDKAVYVICNYDWKDCTE